MYATLLFLFLAFIAEVAGTVGGFGSSVFFVPIARFFLDFQSVLMLTAILHDFSNTSKLLLFRKNLNVKLLILFGVPSTILVIAGAWLSRYLDFGYAELVLGIFLVLFSGLLLGFPAFQISATKRAAIGGGAAAGFLAGLIGTGGAIRGLGLAAFNLEKNAFVATSAGIDFFVDASRTVVYVMNGYFVWQYAAYIPFLFATAFLGSYTGKIILKKISQENFRTLVLVLILLIGITMLIKAFSS